MIRGKWLVVLLLAAWHSVAGQDTIYPLDTVTLIHDKVTIALPSHFTKLTEAEIEERYSAGNHPTEVWADAKREVDVAFMLTPNFAHAGNMENYLSNFQEQFLNSDGTKVETSGLKEINGRLSGYLEVTQTLADGQLYNMMVFTDLARTLFIVTFNCPAPVAEEWKPTCYAIMESLVAE